MSYELLKPIRPIQVDALFSVHYFEYSSTYFFEGESHDFWEFLYVDKGAVTVSADGVDYTLEKGQIIFHAPAEFHTVRANGVVAPNLVVASFACGSEHMQFFKKRILSVDDAQRALLAKIIEEASDAFTTAMDDPLTTNLTRNQSATFAAEQIIAMSIEQLLINFIRTKDESKKTKQSTLIRERSQQDFIDKITGYLEANLSRRLTLSDICKDNLVGRSYLQKIFREKTGGGAMEYFGTLKIKAAKRMVREGNHNFTEIATLLGYNSIHYFSRHFKKVTGMTPSEYASSVKVLSSRTKHND